MAIFCPNCGTQNSDEDKFCQSCGTKLEGVEAAAAPAAAAADGFNEFVTPAANDQPSAEFVYQGGEVPMSDDAPVKKKGNAAPIIIAVAAVAVVGVIAGILMSINKYTKIDAKDLFDIEFAGPDGYGVCYAQLDIDPAFAREEYDVYMEDYSLTKAKKDSDEEKIEYSKYFASDRKGLEKAYPKKNKKEAEEIRDTLLKVNKKEGEFRLKCEPSQTNGLKNGDKVTIEVEYDEDEFKENKIKLENTSFEVEVKGLVSAETIDPFDGVELKYSGIDGDGTVDYDSIHGSYPFIYYSYEGSTYDHSNGDEFVVTAEIEVYYLYDYVYLDDDDHSKGFWFKYDDKLYVWNYEDTIAKKTFTISGLTELNEIDPMDEIEFKYDGAVPFLDISVDIKSDSKYADWLSVSIDDSYNDRYNIGDTFTIKVYGWSSLKENGYKLKGADSSGYVIKELTVEEGVPAYVTADNAEAANEAFDDKFKDTETAIKQNLSGARNFSGTSYKTRVDFDKKVEKVKKSDVIAVYHVFNDISDASALGYGATINRIARVYKMELELAEGKQTVYFVNWIDNIIYADGAFSSSDDKVVNNIYKTKEEALSAIEDLAGYTVTTVKGTAAPEPEPEEDSKPDEDSKADDESKADEEDSKADTSETDDSKADDESKADDDKSDDKSDDKKDEDSSSKKKKKDS